MATIEGRLRPPPLARTLAKSAMLVFQVASPPSLPSVVPSFECLGCRQPPMVSGSDRFVQFVQSAGWGYEQGKQDGNSHDACNHVERFAICTARLAQIRNQERSKCAGGAPCSQHESVDGAHIPRSKVVGHEGRHGPKPSAIAHEHDEGDDCQYTGGVDAGKSPKE